jgi:hypothetical protein
MPVDDSYDTLVGRVKKLEVLPFLVASLGRPPMFLAYDKDYRFWRSLFALAME